MRIDAIAGQQAIAATLQSQAATDPQQPTKSPDPSADAASKATAPVQGDLHQAVDTLNNVVQKLTRNLAFTVDKTTGLNVVKVIETDTNTVIRQIPSDEVLNVARALDHFQGLLIRNKA